MSSIFIAGTDTEIGKTFVASGLLAAMARAGKNCAGFKPVAAGCELINGQWRNEDADALMAAASQELAYSAVNPVALKEPIAPHIAALRDGVELNQQVLSEHWAEIQARAENWVVEGAGGWHVPLNERERISDWVSAEKLPVILVVGMRLGCINHALLSVEAIEKSNHLLGWVANILPPEQPQLAENLAYLKQAIAAPMLGCIPAGGSEQAFDHMLAKLDNVSGAASA